MMFKKRKSAQEAYMPGLNGAQERLDIYSEQCKKRGSSEDVNTIEVIGLPNKPTELRMLLRHS